MKEILPFVKLEFGPPTIVCWSRSDSFWIALMEISLMAILFSSSDDCRWPKIQFKKPEKNVFCKPRIFTFCKFCVLATFCHRFDHICCCFDDFSIYIYYFFVFTLFWLSIFSSKINRWFSAKSWKFKKSLKI